MHVIACFKEQSSQTCRQSWKTLPGLPCATAAKDGLPFPGQVAVGADADNRFPEVIPYVTGYFPDLAP